MKILMLCPQYFPLTGGYERAADRLATELIKLGNQVDIFTDINGLQLKRYEVKNGYCIYRLFSIHRKGLHQLTFLISLTIQLSFSIKKYDIIHIHQHGYAGLLALIMSKLFKKPTILKITGTGDLGLKFWLDTVPGSWAIRRMYKLFNAYIATSSNMINELIEIGIEKGKIFNIPNPVDTSQYKPLNTKNKLEQKFKFGKLADCVVLYVGRLDQNKNPEMLLNSWVKIANEFNNIQLIILGYGPQYSQLKNTFQCESIDFIGLVDNPLPWYQISDIFVLPSNSEGFSNSLLEAMSCGLAIIATKVSGAIDVFEKSEVGKLINIGSSYELYQSLRLLINNRDLIKRFGQNARSVTESNYNIESITNVTIYLYSQLISK